MEPKQVQKSTDPEALVREAVLGIQQDLRDLLQQHLKELDILLINQVTKVQQNNVSAAPAAIAPAAAAAAAQERANGATVEPSPTPPPPAVSPGGGRWQRIFRAQSSWQLAGLMIIVFSLGWLVGRGFGPQAIENDTSHRISTGQTGKSSTPQSQPGGNPAAASPPVTSPAPDARIIERLKKVPEEWATAVSNDKTIREQISVLDGLTPPAPVPPSKKKPSALRSAIAAHNIGLRQPADEQRIVIALLQLKLNDLVDGSLAWTVPEQPAGRTAPALRDHLDQKYLPSLGLSPQSGESLIGRLAKTDGAPPFPALLNQLERAVLLHEFGLGQWK